MPRPQDRRRRRAGFTLIEVLLVLAILVIIASLAVVTLTPAHRKAQVDAARSQIGLFDTPIQMYKLGVGSYPPTLDALREMPANLPDPSKWDGPYLDKAIPLDPWGQPYNYITPGVHNPDSYDVWSSGPDGVDNTDDDIGNWDLE